MLLALLEGRGAQEIMERDDGFIYAGDPSDYFAPFRRWPPVERRVMRYVRGRVLDVGCGAGRVALHRCFVDDGSPRYAAVLEKTR